MSATTPMLFEDSLFESQILIASDEHTTEVVVPSTKQIQAEPELGSALPMDRKSGPASPMPIHSSVLDSVFSCTMDELENTPMFDELDFIVDGAKVNSKEDWVSLFGTSASNDEPLLSLEDLGAIDEEEIVPRDEAFSSDATVSAESANTTATSSPGDVAPSTIATSMTVGSKRRFSDVEESFEFQAPKQLFTPNPSSTLPTPLLDSKKKLTKVDHLGCVTYSKKSRSQPLQPVVMDPTDPVSLKRAKNTEAARRSRARKMERMTQLETRVEELIDEKSGLEHEVLRLRELLTKNGIQY